MPNLLERFFSPLGRAEALKTWPPAVVAGRWSEALDNLRRYTNDREARLQYAPEFNRSAYGRRIYTPVAAAREICNFSAEMLFSAEPQITFEDDEDLLERVQDVNGLASRLIAMAAIVAAQGRGGLRIITDTHVNPDGIPLITHVHEHEVIWDERHGGFVVGGAVIIERQPRTSSGLSSNVYRLVEEHVAGGVARKLYMGTTSQLGSEVALNTLDEFAGLPPEEDTSLDIPSLIRWDNVSGGYSDLAGAHPILDRIDAEVSYGAEKSEKARPVSFAPSELFDAAGRVDITGIIPLRESKMAPLGKDTLQERFGTIQPELLASETIAWVDFLIDTGLMFMGYSKASYGRDDGGAESGTAIKRRQWRTQMKASGKTRMATEAIKNALAIALAWEDGASGSVADYRPEVKLSDPFPRDELEEAQQAQTWKGAGAISLEEMVRMRRPDWGDEQVDEEIARIEGETSETGPRTSIDSASKLIEDAVRNGGGANNGSDGNPPTAPRR